MNTIVSPGSVLVGADGSQASSAAVEWAAAYASTHRRPLTIVHGTGAPVVTDFGIDLSATLHDLRIAGGGVVAQAREVALGVSDALEVTVLVDTTDPRTLLAETARDAHLLVVGSRGHGAVLSLLLGSVSVALAAHAPCPVVVVRPSVTHGSVTPAPVVVGIDGTADAAAALTFGFELASAQGRPVEVVHAAGEPWMFPVPDQLGASMVEVISSDWELLLAESVAGYGEKFPDVTVSSVVMQGSAVAALVSRSERAATVVVGARGRGALTQLLLGSVSRSVVEHAHCTVAVVRGAGR